MLKEQTKLSVTITLISVITYIRDYVKTLFFFTSTYNNGEITDIHLVARAGNTSQLAILGSQNIY